MPRSVAKTFALRMTAAFVLILLYALNAPAQATQSTSAKIPMPPLAWSSWNSFSNTINSEITMQQAKAMVATGLQKAGYEYVNIDEGWWLGNRDADGNFVIDPKAWPAIAKGETPGDMGNIARYIHSLGLKAGIYTDAGKEGCYMYPDIGPAYPHVGSEGHYEQDFLQFAKWGYDYVKVDWCGGDKENLSAAIQYGEITRAIAHAEQITGKRLYYSICNWGKQSPWTWAPGVGGSAQAIWRVNDDIVAPVVAGGPNTGRTVDFVKMLRNFDQGIHPEAQHTGYYNDPDMMVLGMPGLNAQQNRLHLALWAISAAPLIIGADLAKLDPETTATLLNPEVIAIDQDPLGLQAIKIKEPSTGLEVWSKFQSTPGTRAVLLLNRSLSPASISVDWTDLGLSSGSAKVRDIWAGKDLEPAKNQFIATVPAQDGLLLMVRGSEGSMTHYTPVAAKSHEQKAITTPQVVFDQLAQSASTFAQVEIVYTNKTSRTEIVDLYVNGETGTRVAFPPTGNARAAVWLQARLLRPGPKNTLTFDLSPASTLKIESVDVH